MTTLLCFHTARRQINHGNKTLIIKAVTLDMQIIYQILTYFRPERPFPTINIYPFVHSFFRICIVNNNIALVYNLLYQCHDISNQVIRQQEQQQ